MLQIMTHVQTALLNTLRDRKGVSATEYTLMVVGIAALVLAGAKLLGSDISTALSSIGSYLTGTASGI